MANTVDKVLKIAEAEIGYLEKSKTAYKKDSSILYDKTKGAGSDNYTKYGKEMHGLYPSVMDFPASWCDAFVDWCFYKAYGTTNAKGLLGGDFNDYTVASSNLYKKKNAWYTIPKVGDQIFFRNATRICHTGLVYKVDNTYVYTIEGNSSGASGVVANGGGVCRKKYLLTYSRIAGYGRPKYDVAETVNKQSSASASTSKTVTIKPTLKISSNVKAIQSWLNKYYNTNLKVDGVYGANTKKALIKAWQTEVGGLTVDGDFGEKSKDKAEKLILKKGNKGIIVTILQATLTCQGYACAGGIDGDFGSGTEKAVKLLQKKHKLTQDAVVGKKSWCVMYD